MVLVLQAVVLVLVLQFWCCFVKHDLVTLVVIMILKDTATFKILFIYHVKSYSKYNTKKLKNSFSMLGTSLLWKSTVAFIYLNVKSAKCLCLLPVVLVLSFWSWSCKQRSIRLGLVTLVLVLRIWSCLHHWTTQDLILNTKSKVIRPNPRPLLTRPTPRPKYQDQDHRK